MKLSCMKLAFVCVATSVLLVGGARSMTIRVGSEGPELVRPGDTWRFLRGTGPASEPADAWKQLDFDDSHWETGPGGFGYGDNDDATVLDDMRGRYVTVYIRKQFTAPPLADDDMLELAIRYDDGFIAYLNGRQVAKESMPPGPGTHTTKGLSHEAGGVPETILLGPAAELLNEGQNVLAIEGHNSGPTSSDFTLAPGLQIPSDTIRSGDAYIVSMTMVTISGRTEAADATAIAVDGATVEFNPATGTWSANVPLEPGMNVVTARALDADANEVDSGSAAIIYAPPANRLAGPLTDDLTLSGAWTLDDTVTVPAGSTLTLEPGTVLLMAHDVSLVVEGRLLAEGTQADPIHFTHVGDGTAWKQILFIKATDSRLTHCIVQHTDSEGTHQDYYEPGFREYHEAVVVLACHVDLADCTFENLPDDDGEGDAIAVISDDPVYVGEATSEIVRCRFLGIGQGVHTRFSYVRVEDCFFTGKRGDNDDVDLWGESTPSPLIKDNIFLSPAHDDAINPTRCSARIIGNIIAHTDDHGMVLRDKSSPVVMNNIIIDCRNGGIAIENSCAATLINNTIVDCGRGLRLFDLGRWGPPYRLNPGGGTAIVANCIIWDCPTPIALADSSNLEIADRGSHVTVLYSDIERGRDGISVSGRHSTVTWGPGNIDADPLFADPDQLDLHLRSAFGRWDPDSKAWVIDEITSPCLDAGDPDSPVGDEPFPHGYRVNMGAHGGTAEASKSEGGPVAGTSEYVFLPEHSTLLQTGGFAGFRWTHQVEGQFRLTIDFDARTASFSQVDAIAANDEKPPRTLDVNDAFSMTDLIGTVGEDRSIRFTGKTANESDVVLTLTFRGDSVRLLGDTIPPPNSADFFVLNLDALAQRNYGGGTGEPNDPYLIYTAEHLSALGAEPNDYDKHFKLMADIDLLEYSYDRAVIAPDANEATWQFEGTAFTGVFDGNRHAVLHLTITGKSYLGLFGQLGSGAEVRGLGVVDANITGSYYAIGSLVGNSLRGSITACYGTGTVTGYTHVGGLVGYNEHGDIAASYSTCAVSATFSGNQKAGGLVGVNAGRTTTSYSTGTVSGQRVVGGLAGQTTGSITMCYSTGMVSADENVGGLVGERHPAAEIVTACFWDTQTSGQTESDDGIGLTTAEMQTAAPFLDAGWDFIDEAVNGTDDIWWILEGQDYPRLWWEAAGLIRDD